MLINAKGQITDESGWKIFYDKEFYFSIKYPPDWEFHDGGKNMKCQIFAPEYSSAKYRANISVDAFEVPPSKPEITVKQFAETAFGEFKKLLKDCRMMVSKDISRNGIPEYLVVANGMLDGKYIYVKQVYCLYNNVAYTINYIGEAGIKDPYAIIAGDILSSFQPVKTINQ